MNRCPNDLSNPTLVEEPMKGGPIVLGVIPARLESTRLPGKILLDICGKPMLQHVYDNCFQSQVLDELVVATDSVTVRDFCREEDIPVVMTSTAHESGTDRVHEVALGQHAELIVNIQADEPLLSSDHIDALLRPFQMEPFVQVATLRVTLPADRAADPNVVKVVCDPEGNAIYFSRSPIPYDRDGTGHQYHKHLGIYAYSLDALKLFQSLGPSSLERTEKLEQLRFLEHGIRIRVADAPYDIVGVDTNEDLIQVRQLLQQPRAA